MVWSRGGEGDDGSGLSLRSGCGISLKGGSGSRRFFGGGIS